jgi:hypothetical protein
MPDEPPFAAVHQAAHAVAAVWYGTPVLPVDALTGQTHCEDLPLPLRPTGPLDTRTESVLEAYAVMFLAGPAAEFKIWGAPLEAAEETHPDVARARQILSWMLPDDPWLLNEVLRKDLTKTITDFLDMWGDSVSTVASAALAQGSVTPEQTRQLMSPALEHARRLAAYHEAAHATVLWLEGDGQVPSSIEVGRLPNENSQNATVLQRFSRQFYDAHTATDPADRELAVREVEHVVAGEEMAKLIDPNYPGAVRARGDRRDAQRLARKLADPARQQSAEVIEATARAAVVQRLQDPQARALVDTLASALLAQSPLGEDEIRRVLKEAGGVGSQPEQQQIDYRQ